jgi:hypothetical protein
MALALIPFAAALACGIAGGRPALRGLALLIVVLSPLRGAIEKLLQEAGADNHFLLANALVPALVGALVIGVAAVVQPRVSSLPRPLLAGWVLIAMACVLDLATQTVGARLYLVGLAQYLIYPTFVLAAWPLLERGDLSRIAAAFCAIGSFVALTVMLHAAGVDAFVQAESSDVGLDAKRYAGATGSALHSSAFLGSMAVIAMGTMAAARTRAVLLLGFAAFAVILSGQVLTYTRSGLLIAGLGAVALLVVSPAPARRRLAALVAVGVALGTVAGVAAGVTPEETWSRLARGISPDSGADPQNERRLALAKEGLDDYGDSTFPQKATGQGLALTGNASKLVDSRRRIVESYPVKLLLETGAVGLLLICGFLGWSLLLLGGTLARRGDPRLSAFAAAAIGLLLYAAFYPTLETQILACTWWTLLAVSLRYGREAWTNSS